MRVAIVTELYFPTIGGIQEHIFHFAQHARRKGHDVTIITGAVPDLAPPSSSTEEGVIRIGRALPIVSNGSVGRLTVGADIGGALARLLTKSRFDVVHCHSPLSPTLPLLAPRNTGLPLVGTVHTNFDGKPLMRLFRRQLQWVADRIDVNIAVSTACIRANEAYVRADVRVIPNGVDCAMWARGRPLPWAGRRPTALFVGRLEKRSGLDRLLRAWALLLKSSDAELVVIGDGPERESFRALAGKLGVAARFVGTIREQRPDYFASADLLVCPMTIASFGVTLLEGMAAGLPIIASDIAGFREVMTHDREGVLIDTADRRLLADHLQRLFASPALRGRYGDAGRITAASYDWDHISDRILDVYREVTA